ncbi:MAG: hypothetical protein NVSMB68_02490 [Thermoanaerobaculia bacterium]
MKVTSVREFRARLAEFIEGRDPLLVTRHGEHVAVVYPLNDSKRIPQEVRRRLLVDLTSNLASRLGSGDEVLRTFLLDPVIEVFKRDVDRTLIRENLRRTPEERLRGLEALQRLAEEARQARPRRRR